MKNNDFSVYSPGIQNGEIDRRYGSRSDYVKDEVPQLSLPLRWENIPDNTKSFAILFIDFDNCREEGFPWVHWIVANIPADITALAENCGDSIKQIHPDIVQGMNSWISDKTKDLNICCRYGGPAPERFPHEYTLVVYALEDRLELMDGFFLGDFLRAVEGKVIDIAKLAAYYSPNEPSDSSEETA